ncbi:hypothetical protein [Argonema galeatum]|uniref:hypothetical protein n=1 Tax=Argonema galeatum TaxID=2942762 RepID=UPI002012280C|nr:hypothetical protein [Argonema galeatum]MCL1466519.1 hypothetical protein [Argonema galeatum A003/A1]
MNKQTFGFVFVLLLAGFIIAGDGLTFLPKPVRQASLQSRTFVVGLFPKWIRPKDRDAGRKNDIKNLENGQEPKPQ